MVAGSVSSSVEVAGAVVAVPGCSSAGVVCGCSVDTGEVVDARRVKRSPGNVVLGGCASAEVSWTTEVLPAPPGVVCGADVSSSTLEVVAGPCVVCSNVGPPSPPAVVVDAPGVCGSTADVVSGVACSSGVVDSEDEGEVAGCSTERSGMRVEVSGNRVRGLGFIM